MGTSSSADWVSTAGGGGTPAAPSSSVQYNNSGAFGGDSGFTYDGAGTASISLLLNVPEITMQAPTQRINFTSGSIYDGGSGVINLTAGGNAFEFSGATVTQSGTYRSNSFGSVASPLFSLGGDNSGLYGINDHLYVALGGDITMIDFARTGVGTGYVQIPGNVQLRALDGVSLDNGSITSDSSGNLTAVSYKGNLLDTNTGLISVNPTTHQLSDPSGAVLIDFSNTGSSPIGFDGSNNVYFGNGVVVGAPSTPSVDFNSHFIYASDGTTNLIDYSNSSSFGNYYFSGGILQGDGSGLTDVTAEKANYLYDTAGTPALTADGVNRQLVDTVLNFSLDWEARGTYDSSTYRSIDWQNRLLLWTNGTDTTLDWSNRVAYGISAVPSVNWGTRQLIDNTATGQLSVDWLNRTLQNVGGATVAIDYSGIVNPLAGLSFAGQIADFAYPIESKYDSVASIDTNARLLMLNSTDQMLNWNGDGTIAKINIVTAGVYFASNIVDNTGFGSINPTSRLLYDSTNVPAIDWNSRILRDSVNAVSVDWSGRIFNASDGTTTLINYTNTLAAVPLSFNSGAVAFNGAYTFPVTDSPTPGYQLTSDGSGAVTWQPASNGAWLLAGNAGTTAGTDFIGTTDAVDLVFKTNNTEYLRIDAAGNIKIATVISDGSAVASVDANNRVLSNGSGGPVIDYASYLLKDAGAGSSLDWGNRETFDGTGTAISSDWGARSLYEADGTTKSVNWSGTYDSASILSFDTGNAVITSNLGIGTSTPLGLLDVKQGSGELFYGQSGSPYIQVTLSDPTASVGVQLLNDVGYGLDFDIYGSTAAGTYLGSYGLANMGRFIVGPGIDTFVINSESTAPLIFGTNNTERLHIDGSTGAIRFNVAYEFPTADGNAGDVLTTDGSGTLTFQVPGAGAFYTIDQTTPQSITNGSVTIATAGYGLEIKEGSNAKMGLATLSGGTVTVSTTAVTANSRIFLTDQGGTVTNLGSVYISARTAGTSFTISSTNILDASDVAWMIVEPL